MQRTSSRTAVIGATVFTAAVLLAACGRSDDSKTVGQKTDGVIAQAESKMAQAGNATADKAKDMAITAELKTQLAKDDRLSATSINVDTTGGQVTLRGAAPDSTAREHATDLAKAVSGVSRVDNQLTVKK